MSEDRQAYNEFIALLQAMRSGVYLHTGFESSPCVGVHAGFFRFPSGPILDREGFVKKKMDKRLERIREIIRKAEPKHPERQTPGVDYGRSQPLAPAVLSQYSRFFTLGHWDAAILHYLDDFTQMTDASMPLPGCKEFYGYVLATNSEVDNGCITGRPFGSAPPRAGVFAHYKMNPLLLFSGRKALLRNAAYSIALLLGSPPEFWANAFVQKAWRSVLEPTREKIDRGFEALYRGPLRYVQEHCGDVRFLVYRNLGWEDLSVYLMGGDTTTLANLALFIRDMPIYVARFSYRISYYASQSFATTKRPDLVGLSPFPDGPFGIQLSYDNAKKDEAQTREILSWRLRQEEGYATQDKDTVREFVPELPVFCDYTEAYTSPQSLDKDNPGNLPFRALQFIKGRAGRTWKLGKRDSSTPPLLLTSGISDFLIDAPANAAIGTLVSRNDPIIYGTKTRAIVAIAGELFPSYLVERPVINAIGALLDRRFPQARWDKLSELTRRLKVQRHIRMSMDSLLASQLALVTDPTLVNGLFDYIALWDNLLIHLYDAYLMGRTPPSLSRDLGRFLESASEATSTRYHGSGQMFEVSSLNPNHRGGMDLFLNAYSEFIRSVIGTLKGVDREALPVSVSVTLKDTARVVSAFGCQIEVDWSRLATPEDAAPMLLHEVGHAILRDNAWHGLSALVEGSEAQTVYARLDTRHGLKVGNVLLEVFADVFMLRVIRASLSAPGDPAQPGHERAPLERVVRYYDRSQWRQLERRFQGDGADIDRFDVIGSIVRWYLAREAFRQWPPVGGQLVDEDRASIRAWMTAIGEHSSARREEMAAKLETDKWRDRSHRPEERPESKPSVTALRQAVLVIAPTLADLDKALEQVRGYAPTIKALFKETSDCRTCHAKCRDPKKCDDIVRRAQDALASILPGNEGAPDTERQNVQFFLCLAQTMLDVSLEGVEGAKQLQSLSETFKLAEDLLEEIFGSKGYSSYAELDDAGCVKVEPTTPYARVIVHPRGSTIVVDSHLRERVFARRLEVLEELSEARLRRIMTELLELSIKTAPPAQPAAMQPT